MDTPVTTSKQVAQRFSDLADTAFFKALCEPVRVKILALLAERGRSDISTLAEAFTQDRSVISRHLTLLEDCGMVTCDRAGRHRYYQINGALILQNLEGFTAQVRQLVACCGC